MITRDYIVYLEDYSFSNFNKKLGEVHTLSLAKDYLMRIKDNYINRCIELYVKYKNSVIFSIDCLTGEVFEK